MKDITLKGKWVKREIIIVALCLIATYLVNIYAIAAQGASWRELYTTWYAILFVAALLYIVTILVRLAVWGLWRLIRPLVCRKKSEV